MNLTDYIYYAIAALNAVTFLVFGIDKLLAIWGWRRVSERHLMMMLVVAPVGAMVAILLCRHKIRKPKFWVSATLLTLIQIFLFVRFSGVC